MTWECSHYGCDRTDVAPVVYWVLGSEFIRILCPEHQPIPPESERHQAA